MKLLIKFPTRGRPEKSVVVLKKYINLAADIKNINIIVSIDEDDKTLNEDMFKVHECVKVYTGPSSGKIAAINRDMPDSSTFDIVLLASDDMIPIVKGYDNIIRSKMREEFPDTDGVLWFNDGNTGYRINTLIICGSKYYSRFGYLYNPAYKSLWCDNEFMDEANRLGRQVYFDDIIIKHEHYFYNKNIVKDSVYDINQTFDKYDKEIYYLRRFKDYDISILICTIPSRKYMFIKLLNKINKLKRTTKLNVQVLYNDKLTITIGNKRNILLSEALGKYCAFIDDDDDITDEYFKIIEESELKYDCISLNGMMYTNGENPKPFYHSIKYDKWTDNNDAYYRYPNHLNPMKTDIANKIRFLHRDRSEDYDFSNRLLNSKLLKTEFTHDKLQYLYMFVSNKPPIIQKSSINKFLKIR